MGVLVRFKLRNGSIDNRVMGTAVLNDRIGGRNIFAEKNLMIIKSFVGHTFFNLSILIQLHLAIQLYILQSWHGKCQYLILVYIINTCKERQNLHVRCENSECYFPNLHVLYANLGLWCCWYVVVIPNLHMLRANLGLRFCWYVVVFPELHMLRINLDFWD